VERKLRNMLAGLAISIAGCGTVFGPAGKPPAPARQDLDDIVKRHRIVTAGIGLIGDGALVWEGYFGEQSPGVPATAETRFNVASITKTVAAETILRLAGQGRLSLDEPMATYWVDPDLEGDPRHLRLTPRMALDHSTGLPNWRFFLRGGKLAFQHDPGERYTYSGEGLEYLARFAERKLGKTFPELVAETVLDPLGMKNTSLVVRRGEAATIARPVDGEGKFPGYYCRPEGKAWCREEGSFSAADDMVTTVRDYAAFLKSVAMGDGYPEELAADRDRVQTDKGKQSVVDCAAAPEVPCPDGQGYGLGFNVLRYGEVTVLGHGGADWSELAIAYIAKPSRAGVVIFLNAPNRQALAAMPELLELVDPASPFLPEYRRWLAEAQSREASKP
jgi:CubicO group peptidase (beta-lactamase class C family)